MFNFKVTSFFFFFSLLEAWPQKCPVEPRKIKIKENQTEDITGAISSDDKKKCSNTLLGVGD